MSEERRPLKKYKCAYCGDLYAYARQKPVTRNRETFCSFKCVTGHAQDPANRYISQEEARELLRVCKYALANVGNPYQGDAVWREVRAAVAKAEGRKS